MTRRIHPSARDHRYQLRSPGELWRKLVERAATERVSINTQINRFIEAGLLDSPVANGHPPSERLPWIEADIKE